MTDLPKNQNNGFGGDFAPPQQLRGEWAPRPNDTGVVALPERTMLIAGAGGIGGETARLAAAFGMTVIATDARRTSAPPGVTELHPPEAFDTLLPRADFVVLTVPHTPSTEGFMSRARLQRMKPGAFFINVGRGGTVVTDDLVQALRTNRLGGAGLDVTDPEPLPANHPLWHLPNVIITPHVSSDSEFDRGRHWEIARENLRRYAAGERMLSVVDIKRGY